MKHLNIFQENTVISSMIEQYQHVVDEYTNKYDIPAGYLKTSLALHIPKYDYTSIFRDQKIIEEECSFLAKFLKSELLKLPKNLQKEALKDNIGDVLVREEGNIYCKYKDSLKIVTSKIVPKDIGDNIQEHLHYLHATREDSLIHFGLFVGDSEVPIAYCSFSKIDRKYLERSLPNKVTIDNTLVLTRVFAFNSNPKNSISVMISESFKYISRKYKNKYKNIISAVNPNMLMEGNSFRASGFKPFALVEYSPIYYDNIYYTRKKLKTVPNLNQSMIKFPKIEFKPTVWLGTTILSSNEDFFENIQLQYISESIYLLG